MAAPRRSLAKAVEVMGGERLAPTTGPSLDGPSLEGRTYAGALLDSRQVKGGELFFALPGERTDGHRFVGAALAAGAAAAIVCDPSFDLSTSLPGGDPKAVVIRVPDTLAALHGLTRSIRAHVPEHLVGITGSVGKTTTKELLGTLLARRYAVARSPGNLNNLLGFPLALLGIPESTQWMVAEMGMSTPGELGALSRLARPDVVLLLNVRPAHLESFASLEAIAEAKGEILQGLPADGLVVANADDPRVARLARRFLAENAAAGGRVVWFGQGPEAEVRLSDLEEAVELGREPHGEGGPSVGGPTLAAETVTGHAVTGTRFTVSGFGQEHRVELPLHGHYNAENALAAIACALALGVSLEEVATDLRGVRPGGHRGVVHPLPRQATLIDDCYNSSPEALTSALRSAAAMRASRHWAVLGDMLELGPEAPRFHREAGRQAAALGFSPVAGVGELARELADAARAEGAESPWFPDAGSAAGWAVDHLRPGDLVLVKGSRGVGLEQVVEALTAGETGSRLGEGTA